MKKLRYGFATSALVAGLSLAGAPQAAGSVAIGQLPPAPGAILCADNFDHIQGNITSGNTYVVPATGKLTSWSHNANANAGQSMSLKVFRLVSGTNYTVVGHDGPRSIAASTVNTFGSNIAVQRGDVLGLHVVSGNPACRFAPGDAADTVLFSSGDLADGASGNFGTINNRRLNVTAIFDPSNTFTLGAPTRNKKKGTARLAVTVPNAGQLAVSGNGVKPASARSAAITVAAPGTVTVPIRARGKKKKKKLNSTGKVKVTPSITYTPTNGTAATRSLKVKLKKNI